MFAHWAFGSLTYRHQSLAPRTLLRISRSSNPRPPWFLGLQTFSQETKAHFFLVSSLPQRKSLWIELNFYKTPFRTGITDSINIGIVWSTTSLGTGLLARFKAMKVYFLTLSFILIISGSHTLLSKGLTISGTPKYLRGGTLFESQEFQKHFSEWQCGC